MGQSRKITIFLLFHNNTKFLLHDAAHKRADLVFKCNSPLFNVDFKLCIKKFDIVIENISHKSWTIHARFQPSNTQLYFITANGYRCQDNFRANSI